MLTPEAKVTVDSPDYQAERSRPLRWTMLCPPHQRAEAYLQAVWEADDAGRDASPLRLKAASLWDGGASTENALRLIDILRRAGDFERAASVTPPGLDENSRRIVAYQHERIAARDTGRHMLSSALRPPARMPHVAHGTVSPKGLFARLLGR